MRARWLAPLLVGCMAVLPYLPALGFGLLGLDDTFQLGEADLHLPLAQALRAALLKPHDALYSPVTALSFLLDIWIHAVTPRWGALFSHAVSLVLHGATTALVLVLGRRLALPRGAALCGALLFAWHPLHTESIAWISARKDLLVGLLSLGCVLCAAQPRRLVACWVLGLLALLAKPTAAFLPLLALVWPLWFPGCRRQSLALRFAPLLLLAVVVVKINLLVKLSANDLLRPEGFSMAGRVWLPLHVLGAQVRHFLMPLGLSPIL